MVWSAVTVALCMVAAGCQQQAAPPASPAKVEVELASGTKVPMMLMKQLESGIDDEGAAVPLMVTEDVKDQAGHVLIPKGTAAEGRVAWSRREGTLDGFLGRPARLNVSFQTTVAADGQPVDLCADTHDPKAPFELNRTNTGFANAAKLLDEVTRDERDERVLVAVQQLFDNGDARELDSKEGRERLHAIAEKLQLPGLSTLAQQGDVGKVRGLLDQLRRGGSISQLAPAAMDGPLSLTAVMEMAQVARKMNDRMNKATHGRNIKAYIGTPVTAYVAKTVKVSVKG